jgi:outer membrane protein OmpA-like peptidoglycan-associated protein
MQGATTVGPAGPAGRPGEAGVQGVAGQAGAQGSTMAGVAGPAGRPGPPGPQGTVGPEGARGSGGAINRWVSFRDFTFQDGSAEIQYFDAVKVTETAAYMSNNPSHQVAIDGSMDPRGTDPRNQSLNDRRIGAVRDALINAGVPASRIQTGTFGDPQLTRDRRVEVLVSSAN